MGTRTAMHAGLSVCGRDSPGALPGLEGRVTLSVTPRNLAWSRNFVPVRVAARCETAILTRRHRCPRPESAGKCLEDLALPDSRRSKLDSIRGPGRIDGAGGFKISSASCSSGQTDVPRGPLGPHWQGAQRRSRRTESCVKPVSNERARTQRASLSADELEIA